MNEKVSLTTTEQEISDIKTLIRRIESLNLSDYPKNLELIPAKLAHSLLLHFHGLLRGVLAEQNHQDEAGKISRKFTDAGRRSPPWQPGSTKGYRRPQDGADGNRRSRWLFPPDHDFYATETMGCLVEMKYILQCFSMQNPPPLPTSFDEIRSNPLIVRILGHPVGPDSFHDPLTLENVDFEEFRQDRRYLESGHIVPHAQGGKHTCRNATMMLRSSNRIQADYTIEQSIERMAKILRNHGFTVIPPDKV